MHVSAIEKLKACMKSNPEYNKLSPMTYMYYAMLLEMRKRGYQRDIPHHAHDKGFVSHDGL